MRVEGFSLVLIQIYLRTGGDATIESQCGHPLTAFHWKDWQNPPEELASMVVQSKYHVQIGASTLHGAQVDSWSSMLPTVLRSLNPRGTRHGNLIVD